MDKIAVQSSSGKIQWYVYVFTICLYIYAMANVLWFETIPRSLVYFLAFFVLIWKLLNDGKRFNSRSFVLCSVFFIYCLLAILIWENSPNSNYFFTFLWGADLFLFATSLILLSTKEKELLLAVITKCLMIIIVISVPVWFLYLAGFNLPHSDVIYHKNGFHVYINYYYFRLGVKNGINDLILPRFSSMFLEPGQLATPCVFAFFMNGARFCRKNIPFIVAIVLSFSLVAYILLIFGYFARFLLASKRHFLFRFVLVAVVFGSFFYFASTDDETNPINMYIISRLEYDEDKIIVGNNRTSNYFDSRYEQFFNSSDMYFGISDELEEYDWTYNCSGYKKFIVRHGIVGFAIFMSFILLMFFYNRSKASFIYLIILLIAFFVRDLLQAPLWLSYAILGLTILGNNDYNKVFFNNNSQKMSLWEKWRK